MASAIARSTTSTTCLLTMYMEACEPAAGAGAGDGTGGAVDGALAVGAGAGAADVADDAGAGAAAADEVAGADGPERGHGWRKVYSGAVPSMSI